MKKERGAAKQKPIFLVANQIWENAVRGHERRVAINLLRWEKMKKMVKGFALAWRKE